MLNADTGIVLVLPGKAADLRQLPAMAAQQLGHLLQHHGIGGPLAAQEVQAWANAPVNYAATRSRSLLTTMNQRKYEVWTSLEHQGIPAYEIALEKWTWFYRHPTLRPNPVGNMGWYEPLQLLRKQLMPAAEVIDLGSRKRMC